MAVTFPSHNETGNWIATFSGRWIEPLTPNPEDIDIEDIAHSLSQQCRFTGHTKEFYSIAQHCYLVSFVVPEEFALWGLLHDASEAYVSDIARPVKHSFEDFGTIYKKVEETLLQAIAVRFNLTWPEPEEIKLADKMLLRAEQRDLMPNDPEEGKAIYEDTIDPWEPATAEINFLGRYYSLIGG